MLKKKKKVFCGRLSPPRLDSDEALQVAWLQMLSNGGVRMTPAAVDEQVTDNVARQGLKVQVDIERVSAFWTRG